MQRSRVLVALAALSVLSVLTSGCGSSDSDGAAPTTEAAADDGGTTTDTEATEITIPDDAPDDVDTPVFEGVTPRAAKAQADDDPNTVYLDALDSLQVFWGGEFPSLYGEDFAVLPPERILPIATGEDSLGETCDGSSIAFDTVQGNAVAFQCPEGQLVAWDADPDGLMATTAEQYGPLASSAILAHEFGHVVQYQSGTALETPYSELQADCFAGAWVAVVSQDPPPGLEGFADPAAVDATISAMLTLRDPVGFDAQDEDAHGNGFDRVRSYQDGYERGAEQCAGYVDQPPTVTEAGFTDQAEADTGGNLDLETLIPAATADLDAYYGYLVEGWEPLGTLEVGDVDQDQLDFLSALSDAYGDGAPLVFLGLGWAQSLQVIVGADEGRDATGQLLQAACLTGDWMGHLYFDVEGDPTVGELSLSPGDLDEALLALIDVQSGSEDAEPGGVFELISAYRQGVVDRIGSCGL